VVNTPPRGIGGKSVAEIRVLAKAAGIPLWQAAAKILDEGLLTGRARKAISAFLLMIEKLDEQTAEADLGELVEVVVEASGLKDYHAKEGGERGQARVENMAELVTAAETFDPSEDYIFDTDPDGQEVPNLSLLDEFLSHAALEAGEGQGDPDQDCVQLMTMHSAKGLEFPLVFLSGLEDGLFPHMMSLEEPGRLEEERRLCYVGMTRAMEKLYIIHAEMRNLHGNETFNPPSRFLREIPPELTQEISTGGAIGRKSYDSKGIIVQGEIPETDLVLGQRVVHEVFGEGVILNYEGQGANARVEVNFDSSETKWLMASYAKLRTI
jgi:DNA helicase-2/ATP-dependent DNA helicase PcrA